MAAALVFVVVFVSVMATLYYLAEDARDESIGKDAFRPDRAAVIARLQDESRARFQQRKAE